jgi:hypothetical protein
MQPIKTLRPQFQFSMRFWRGVINGATDLVGIALGLALVGVTFFALYYAEWWLSQLAS